MQFPANVFLSSILSVVYLLIAFQLRLPKRLKKFFRMYSIVINLIFLLFLTFFTASETLMQTDQGITIYFNGLSSLYFLIFLPLVIVLVWLFAKPILKADIEPVLLKYLLILFAVLIFIILFQVGYGVFIMTFYGFAP